MIEFTDAKTGELILVNPYLICYVSEWTEEGEHSSRQVATLYGIPAQNYKVLNEGRDANDRIKQAKKINLVACEQYWQIEALCRRFGFSGDNPVDWLETVLFQHFEPETTEEKNETPGD